jgi:hypothetical protein
VRRYRITLRDRETQTIVGYYDGSWTTDRRRAVNLREREVGARYYRDVGNSFGLTAYWIGAAAAGPHGCRRLWRRRA